jgi:hypothetical protein
MHQASLWKLYIPYFAQAHLLPQEQGHLAQLQLREQAAAVYKEKMADSLQVFKDHLPPELVSIPGRFSAEGISAGVTTMVRLDRGRQ